MGITNISYSIDPISGNPEFAQLRHLLDRCLFGARKVEIDSLINHDISSSINQLLKDIPMPESPVGFDPLDLDVALGQPWHHLPYSSDYNIYRRRSYRAWWIGLMMQSGISLVEKMVLFWHNHFVTEIEVVDTAPLNYQYNQILRRNALGNIKQMAYEITIDPAMLIYLNGESNKASAPNENYGRELFELFTIGKGPLIAEGNYTNYTEEDIREAAKVLTGWKVDKTLNKSYFTASRHDQTTKVFSEVFGKAPIDNHDSEEYKYLIDMIFSQKETARFLARKIYRWFLYYDISPEVEKQIIEPLATTLYENDYNVKPMLAQFLSSQHFFSPEFYGSMIKNPLDFTIGIFRKCEISLSESDIDNYKIWLEIYYACKPMELILGDPPGVAGWPQYYLAPAYYQMWISSSTLPIRAAYSDLLCAKGSTINEFKYKIDPFKLTSQISDPSNLSALLNGLAETILPIPLNAAQLNHLKEVLIPGLTEATWKSEWRKYANNPSDLVQKTAISKQLLALIRIMLRMPEFYLS
jgi:uncharacterized protein (DUF1800 family)